MTVAEMIEWLKTQDQEAVVRVVQHSSNGTSPYYEQGGVARICDFDSANEDLATYTDFRGNSHVKPDDDLYNKRYLLLGEHNG